MSKINEALQFLKDDVDKAKKQWDPGNEPMQSLLQREDKTLDDLLDIFDPSEDEAKWSEEYTGGRKEDKIRLYRRRIAFLKAARKEFHEEYDPEVTDVDFMRLLEVPFTDSKYVIDWSIDEMGD